MGYFLGELLPLFVYPLSLALILGLVSFFSILSGRKKAALLSGFTGIALLWVCSLPVFTNIVLAPLQQEFPFVSSAQLSTADAIVILGGGIAESSSEGELPQLGRSVNRLFYGLELYKAGKAPWIVLAGGSAPGDRAEADVMSEFLQRLGMEENIILKETRSRTTYENASYAMPLFKQHDIHSILLITSAFHMRRARATFSSMGLNVIPAPVDQVNFYSEFQILNWLPDVEALSWTSRAFHEYLGLKYYRLRGWIRG